MGTADIGLCFAVIVGGSLESYLGSRRFSVPVIHVLLATVQILAGGKRILTKPTAPAPVKMAATVRGGDTVRSSDVRRFGLRPRTVADL